jgi:hypothetical protein
LNKIIKHKNTINFTTAQRLRWLGHIERMPETRMVKAIHCWKPISKRPTGRPKTRWENDVNLLNAELKPICHFLTLLGAHHIFHVSRIRVKKGILKLKVPNWRTLVQDRRWKEVVEKAKILH